MQLTTVMIDCIYTCDGPWPNQPYCTQNIYIYIYFFLDKATITKYGVWTTAGKKILKSLSLCSFGDTSLEPRLCFVGGKESLVHTFCACAKIPTNPGNSDSSVKYHVYYVNYPWHYTVYFSSTAICYACWCLPSQRRGVNDFCLGKVPEPVTVGSRNFERQEQDLAIGNSVGLRK